MSDIKQQVEILQSRFTNHRHQTGNFTWDYTIATDKEVLNTTDVFQDTLDGLTGIILKIVQPQYKKALRKHIHYLTGLRQRQAEAWERYLANCSERTNNARQWVLQHEQ